jgi:hypothetical protein
MPLALNWMSPPELDVAPVSRSRFDELEVESVVVWSSSARAIAGHRIAIREMIRRFIGAFTGEPKV